VLHQDDTTMTILEIAELTRQAAMSDKQADDMDDRTGVFTSGIVSTGDGAKIESTNPVGFESRLPGGRGETSASRRVAAVVPSLIQGSLPLLPSSAPRSIWCPPGRRTVRGS
jgi:hypothetical protein